MFGTEVTFALNVDFGTMLIVTMSIDFWKCMPKFTRAELTNPFFFTRLRAYYYIPDYF